MQFAHLQDRPARGRAGIVLLMVVVLGVMVYFFGMYPQDRQTKRIQKQSPDEYPWVKEWRIKRLGLRAPRGHKERELSDEQIGPRQELSTEFFLGYTWIVAIP